MRARISMRWLVTLFTGFFLTCSLGLMFLATHIIVQEQWKQASLLHARTAAVLLARTNQEALRRRDTATLNRQLRQATSIVEVERVIVTDRLGKVVADSAGRDRRPVKVSILSLMSGKTTLHAEGPRIDVLMPIRVGAVPVGGVFVRCNFSERQPILQEIFHHSLMIGLLTVLLSCLIAYSLAGVISQPAQRLARSMRAVADGQLSERLPEEGCCEQQQMARTFNHMAGSLRRRIRELQSLPALVLGISRSLDLTEVVRSAIASLEAALPETRIQIWLLDSEGDYLIEGSGYNGVEEESRIIPRHQSALLAHAMQTKQVLLTGEGFEHLSVDPWFAEKFGARSLAAVPLCVGESVLGVLVALRGDAPPLLPDELPFLSAAAKQIALSIDNARLFSREAHLSAIFQRLLRPPAPAPVPGLDIAFHWQPAQGEAPVSGDYYDFIALPDGRWGIVIGDVCGKGTIAASYTTMAKYVLRSYAFETTSPAEILQRTNAALFAQFTGADADEAAPPFITMLCALYEPATGRLSYSHAGHPLGTLVRLGSPAATPLHRGGPPVGVIPDATYKEEVLYLAPGDTLALYTDGVVEAAGTEELLEPARIGALLAENQDAPVQAAADALIAEVERIGGGRHSDDVTLLVLRVNGSTPPLALPHSTEECAAG